jgi:ribosomal protein S18 acetylase RimI-like enzyme
MVSIFHATNASSLNHLRGLMRSFVAWHHTAHPEDRKLIDRYFVPEVFERELADLPGPYVLRPFWPARDHTARDHTARDHTARDHARWDHHAAADTGAQPAFAGTEGYYCPYNLQLRADRLREASPPAAVSGLLIAYHGGAPAGCVALRDHGPGSDGAGICEMKRLFVPEAFRGMGVGRALVRRAIAEATQAGYARMRLDTSTRQAEAIRLYEKTGFKRIPPDDAVPPDMASWLIFFERRL